MGRKKLGQGHKIRSMVDQAPATAGCMMLDSLVSSRGGWGVTALFVQRSAGHWLVREEEIRDRHEAFIVG